MAEAIKAGVETKVLGKSVIVMVSGDFQVAATEAGGIKLWPEKVSSQTGPLSQLEDRFWTFTFDTPEEAQAFATESATLTAEAKKKLNWVDEPA